MASDQATETFSNSRRNFVKMAAAGNAVASALSAASATIAPPPTGFETFTWESSDAVSMQAWNSVLGRLPKTIFRTNRFIYLREKLDYRCILQPTSGRAAITVGQL